MLSRSKPSPLTRRAAAGLTLAAVAAIRPGLAGAATAGGEAQRFIDQLGGRVLRTLREAGADREARERAVRRLVDEAVDLRLLGRLVLGRHWNRASEAQRAEYLDLFHAYALQGISSALSGYTGNERISVTGSRPTGEEDSIVATDIAMDPGKPPTRIDWRVRGAGDRFSIVDVVVEGVSLLVTNRAEVDAIVNRSGIDGLLKEMRGWRETGGPSGA